MIIRIFLRVSYRHITRFIEYSLNIFTLLYQYLSITANITESNRLYRLFFTKMCEAFVFRFGPIRNGFPRIYNNTQSRKENKQIVKQMLF